VKENDALVDALGAGGDEVIVGAAGDGAASAIAATSTVARAQAAATSVRVTSRPPERP
jgi:hypothetical protein